MPHRAATCRLCTVAVLATLIGCGIPDESRWDRGETASVDAGERAAAAAFATVEIGPVVEAIEARGRVLVTEPIVVVSDRTGRVESRSTAAGDAVEAGAVVIEFSDAPDPTDQLRIEILRIEREIAELDGGDEEVARLDDAIDEALAATRAGTGDDLTTIDAPVGGVIGEYFVTVFDVVRPGDALFSVGDPARRSVVLTLPIGPTDEKDDVEPPSVGAAVSLLDPRSALGEPIAATVTTIELDELEPSAATDTNTDTDTGGEDDDAPIVLDGPGREPQQRIVVELDESSPFAVGDDVTVVFESTSASESLRLATEAIRGSGTTGHVIVEDASGNWNRVDVRIGARTDRFVQIADAVPALAAGDRVVLP